MDITEFKVGDEFRDTDTDTRMVLIDIPTDGPLFRLPDEDEPFDTCQMETDEFNASIGESIVPADKNES